MFEAESDVSENSNADNQHDWPSANSFPHLSAQRAGAAPPQPHTVSQPASLSQPSTLTQPDAAPTRPEAESSCMEVEAAQRKLQEIEDRITLEDDSEDEDLDVEPAPRRPVLVISDSLKEGLQRGITDILPHTVAQSVSHSCMELVLWRPLDDPFCRKRKVTLPKPRKPQTVPRQTLTPCPSPTPHCSTSPPSPPAESCSHVYSFPVVHGGEEDMEM